jgi:hypothetical protein
MQEPTTEAPIMIRADITRQDVKRLKQIALERDTTVQALVATFIHAGIKASK